MPSIQCLHVADHGLHLVHRKGRFVYQIHLFCNGSELPQAVQWLTIRQPAIVSGMSRRSGIS
jgi:hypothetical protein